MQSKAQITENNKAELEQYKTYTLTELEAILGVTHKTLLLWVKEGKLEAFRPGNAGKWKVTKAALERFMQGGK